ncbi:MAG TPA: glycosyl transferase, partial [Verrucomicrobiae bacterium]|nr:glycosyl transferase [Verrucomicrobiae bacterium]
MALAASSSPRISADGKFFRSGGKKFYAKGVAYGPFAPLSGTTSPGFTSPDQTARDFAQIRALGANLVRVYEVPAQWFLDLASEHKLKVFVDVPWNKHLCFLDSAQQRVEARQSVRRAVAACAGHPAVFAFSVANEIPA